MRGSPTHGNLLRQINHWSLAAERLTHLDDLAAPAAWAGLEGYLGLELRNHLRKVAGALQSPVPSLRRALDDAMTADDVRRLQRRLVAFRARYLRAETTIDFFVDAINTRTNEEIASLLRACDQIAIRAMSDLLVPLGKTVPPILTYLDRGLGASILKAGLLLWDGGDINPVAGVKVVRHNLFRSTALIHEAGHQVAHFTEWNGELRSALRSALAPASRHLSNIWSSWASEIAADAFAFAHAGYGSVAGLHDVLAGSESFVFRLTPGDPHPTSYLRVLLGVAMCRAYYGDGPWDELAAGWERRYPLRQADAELSDIITRSKPLLPVVTRVALQEPMRAFGGRGLDRMIDPSRASPRALEDFERTTATPFDAPPGRLRTTGVRLLALSALKVATEPGNIAALTAQQRYWMRRLGGAVVTKAA